MTNCVEELPYQKFTLQLTYHSFHARTSVNRDICVALLSAMQSFIHLKSPPINTLSNTLSNAYPSLINNECCKYLYIQVAAQPCVTDQNQITLPWMACKRPKAVRDADSVHWQKGPHVLLSSVTFTLAIGKHFFFCIVWKIEKNFMGCVMWKVNLFGQNCLWIPD